MCQAAHRGLGFRIHLSGFEKVPVPRPPRNDVARVKCSKNCVISCHLSTDLSSSSLSSSVGDSTSAEAVRWSLMYRKVVRMRTLKWNRSFSASPSSSRDKLHLSRRAVKVNSTTLLTKSWVSTDELLSNTAAVEEAMAVARAAANAARAAAAYAEAHAACESFEDFPSENDLLLLERARLNEMAKLDGMDSSISIRPVVHNDALPPVWKEWGNGTIESRKSDISVCTGLSPRKLADVCLERNPVEEVGISLEKNPVNIAGDAEMDEPGNMIENNKVAVRSSKRRERMLKRERVLTKAQTQPVRILHSKPKKPQVTYDSSDPVRAYMRDIGRSRLLTAAEEVGLAEGIQDLLRVEGVKASLMEQMGREPSLLEWAKAVGTKNSSLESRIKSGQACKDKMVNSNLRLVVSIAKRYQGRGMTIQDLIQEGSMGLIRGAEKFDHTRGFKFSTYAHWWIRQAITRAIADQSRTVRLPVHVYEVLSRITKARNMLASEHGRVPRDEEVAELVGMNIDKLKMLIKSAKSPKSMEYPIGKNNDTTLGEMIPDQDVDSPEDAISKRLLKQDLDTVLNTLSPREKDVLKLRYGLEDGKMRTLEEIGNVFRVTRERIRQIESKALRKLRQPSRNTSLREYLDVRP